MWSTHCTEGLADTLRRGSGQYIVQRSGQYINCTQVWPIHLDKLFSECLEIIIFV